MRKEALRHYVEMMQQGIGIATHHEDGTPIQGIKALVVRFEWLKIDIRKKTYEINS